MEDLKVPVEKLSVDNYAVWAIQMEALLKVRGLWAPVAGGGSAANDEKALALIMLYVHKQHLHTLSKCETAKEAWELLGSLHKAKSVGRRTHLRKQLTSLRREAGGEAITAFVDRARGIRDQLVAAGYPASDDEVVLSVLAGLPPEYDMVVTMLENAETVPTLDEVHSKLVSVEQRLHADIMTEGTEKAYFSKVGGRRGKQLLRQLRCWGCQQLGHKKSECPQEQRQFQGAGIAAVAL
jgi:gag-polypeptide of LTR copia-type/Domain of unknown function (DUF4219)